MNKGNVAAVAVGVVLFLFTCTENERSLNNQQQTGPAHRMENASVITESAVKGHPSVTARPLKAAEAEGYRYSSGNCIYLKDSRGNSVNQYSLNGNLLKRYEIAGSEEIVEVCWADSSCLIYRIDNQRGEDTLWFVPIAQEDEKEILCLKDRTKIQADIDGVSCILFRRGDELVYMADNRIYKRKLKSGREIYLKKGFQYEDDLEIDRDFNLNPLYKDGRVLFTTSDAKYLLDVAAWKTEKIWEQENGSPDQSANVLSTWNEDSIYFQVEDEQVDVYQYQLSTKKRKRYISGDQIRKRIENMNLFPGQQIHYENIKVFKTFAYNGRLYMDIFLKWKEEGIKESKADLLFSSSLEDPADFRYEPEVSQFMLEHTSYDGEGRYGSFSGFAEGYLAIFPYKDAPSYNLLWNTGCVCYDMEAKEFSCLPDRKILYLVCAAGLSVLKS